jgi:UDP-N-acetylglucosamine--N-acetylmuramyl-(pentapeptide) pyrophosphoryl-undecaprenol N-acetylglucosamine transferase
MNIVIAAGGTGGHLYPAVALAREFLRQVPRCSILFVGTERGIEGKVLPHEGFEWEKIAAKPIMGRGLWQALQAVALLPVACWQSVRLLRKRRADLVIGIGGYTSPPVLAAGFSLRIPRVILEPNAYPGMANKVLGPLADLVFLAYEAAKPYFRAGKVRVTGTPIRREFYENAGTRHETRGTRRDIEQHESPESLAPRPAPRAPRQQDRKTLLVFGGSQGAHAINQAMVEALPLLQSTKPGLSVTHQTGEADYGSVKKAYERAGWGMDRAEVVPFLFDMPRALKQADLVVSRSGAVTLAELTACGKPAILIPLPHAIYQHQERNARVLEEAGAAIVLLQQDLTGPRLAQAIDSLLGHADRLRSMGERSAALGRTDSAEVIVRDCLALVGGGHDNKLGVGAARL